MERGLGTKEKTYESPTKVSRYTLYQNNLKLNILFLLLLSCSKGEKTESSFRLDLIDENTRVQDNLFNHVNGIWSKNTEIPDDRVRWGSFDELREKTSQNLLEIMKKSSIDKNIDPNIIVQWNMSPETIVRLSDVPTGVDYYLNYLLHY